MFGLSFRVSIRVIVYVSLRRRVRRTLNDLYCPYFLPEVMVKFTRKTRGHFVMLIEISMHLIQCTLYLERVARND